MTTDVVEVEVINEDGSIQAKDVQRANMLDDLQKLVGGNVEVIRLGGSKIMLVDEEGLIKGLSFNLLASTVARRQIVGKAVRMNDADLE